MYVYYAVAVIALAGSYNIACADYTIIGEAKEAVKASVKGTNDAVLKEKQGKANGKIETKFAFHEAAEKNNDFTKNVKTGVLDNKTFNVQYNKDEKHGTTGEVLYNLTVQKTVDVNLKHGFETVAYAKTMIAPGTSNPAKDVYVIAKLSDPFSFSNFDLDSTFEFSPAGLDLSFSLLQGTSFPTPPSGMANYMSFTQRLAPASINDAGQFWGQPDPGWIDLFRVFVGADSNNQLSTSVIFGESNRYFDLDFRDANGQPFDSSNSASVAAITASIAAGFRNGRLASDLHNVFTVGFVPRSGTMEYTTGNQLLLDIGGLETPEPLTAGLVFAGLTAFLVWRKVRSRS